MIVTNGVLEAWEQAARVDVDAGSPFSCHPSAILELIAEVRRIRDLTPSEGLAVLVTFAEDPELAAEHVRKAGPRPVCTCGWYPEPTPKGEQADEAAMLEHRRERSRRRIVITEDFFLAWADQFGTRQYLRSGDTGDRFEDAHEVSE